MLESKTFDQTPILNALTSKLNITDSNIYVTPTMLESKTFDQTPILNALTSKLNIADSSKYVTPTSLAKYNFPIFNQNSTGNSSTSTISGNITATSNNTLTELPYLNTVGTVTSGTISLTNNIITKGTIKAGAITYPNIDGTLGSILTSNNNGIPTWQKPISSVSLYDTAISINELYEFSNFLPKIQIAKNLITGENILVNNTKGIANVGVGINDLLANTTGSGNTAVGFNSLYSNTTGKLNVSIGPHALYSNSGGSYNIAIGSESLISSNANYNIGIGIGALSNFKTGTYNTVVGIASGGVINGSKNTFLGTSAGVYPVVNNLTNSTALGFGALVTASNSIQLGNNEITKVSTYGDFYSSGIHVDRDIFSGGNIYSSGEIIANGNINANGDMIASENMIASGDINALGNMNAIGSIYASSILTSGTVKAGSITYPNFDGLSGQILSTNGNGIINWITPAPSVNANSIATVSPLISAISSGILFTYAYKYFDNNIYPPNINKAKNLITGENILINNTKGIANVGVGISDLQANTTGSGNTAVGFNSLYSNTIGRLNVSIGPHALYSNSSGSDNVAIGSESLELSNSNYNTAIGGGSLYNLISGNYNVAIGSGSGGVTDGSKNTFLGASAHTTTSNLTNSIALGYNANVSTSNTIQLGNDQITTLSTFGDIYSKDMNAGGNIYSAQNIFAIENINAGGDIISSGSVNSSTDMNAGGSIYSGANMYAYEFVTKNADYAEYIIKKDTTKEYQFGEIIGIKNGNVVSSNINADRYMIVSKNPSVIGNAPNSLIKNYALIAFVGQVLVKVKGNVRSGEYILASAKDGIGIAKRANDISYEESKKIVGQAWENSNNVEIKYIKVGITPMDMQQFQEKRIKALEEKIERILKLK